MKLEAPRISSGNFGYSATVNAKPRCDIMLPVAAPKHSLY
jgi:hypothetical protein